METYSRTDSARSSVPRRPTIERAARLAPCLCLALVLLGAAVPAASRAQDTRRAATPAPREARDTREGAAPAPSPARDAGGAAGDEGAAGNGAARGTAAGAQAQGPRTGRGAADLEAFLDRVKTLTADFKQQIRAADGHVLQTGSGSVALARPNRFRWTYDKPHPQQIVADGKYLWIYDVDLEQATRAPLDETSPSSPAMLLSGDKAVRDGFDIVESFERDGFDWVRLRPNLPETDFHYVLIGFEGLSPQRLQLEDALNQLTDIELYNVVLNPKLKDRLFEFKPPRGVDVIGEGD